MAEVACYLLFHQFMWRGKLVLIANSDVSKLGTLCTGVCETSPLLLAEVCCDKYVMEVIYRKVLDWEMHVKTHPAMFILL